MNKKTDKNTTTSCQNKCDASCKPTCKKPQKDNKQETLNYVIDMLDAYLEKFTSNIESRIDRLEKMSSEPLCNLDLADIRSSKQDETIAPPDSEDAELLEEPVYITIKFPNEKLRKIKLSSTDQSILISHDGYVSQDDVSFDDVVEIIDLLTTINKGSPDEMEELAEELFTKILTTTETDTKNPIPDVPSSDSELSDFDILQEALQRKQTIKGFICIANPFDSVKACCAVEEKQKGTPFCNTAESYRDFTTKLNTIYDNIIEVVRLNLTAPIGIKQKVITSINSLKIDLTN